MYIKFLNWEWVISIYECHVSFKYIKTINLLGLEFLKYKLFHFLNQKVD